MTSTNISYKKLCGLWFGVWVVSFFLNNLCPQRFTKEYACLMHFTLVHQVVYGQDYSLNQRFKSCFSHQYLETAPVSQQGKQKEEEHLYDKGREGYFIFSYIPYFYPQTKVVYVGNVFSTVLCFLSLPVKLKVYEM